MATAFGAPWLDAAFLLKKANEKRRQAKALQLLRRFMRTLQLIDSPVTVV